MAKQNDALSPRGILSGITSVLVIANGVAILMDAKAVSYALGIMFGVVCLIHCAVIYRFPLEGEEPRSRTIGIVLFFILGVLCIAGSINNVVNHL